MMLFPLKMLCFHSQLVKSSDHSVTHLLTIPKAQRPSVLRNCIRCPPIYMQMCEEKMTGYTGSDTNLWKRILPQKDNSSLYITSGTARQGGERKYITEKRKESGKNTLFDHQSRLQMKPRGGVQHVVWTKLREPPLSHATSY